MLSNKKKKKIIMIDNNGWKNYSCLSMYMSSFMCKGVRNIIGLSI
jgi:hypothetical protein